MKLFKKCKDGGSESPVDAFFLIECKSLFSVAILRFNKGGREAFHTHAFSAYTWFLSGVLVEEDVSGELFAYSRKLKPKKTLRSKNHRVLAIRDSYCLTVRGSWVDFWTEYNMDEDKTSVFTWGRKKVRTLEGLCYLQ